MIKDQIENITAAVSLTEQIMNAEPGKFYPQSEHKQTNCIYFQLLVDKIIELSKGNKVWCDLTMTTVAEQIGISPRSMTRYYSGERKPSYAIQFTLESLLRDVYAELNN